MSFSIDEALVKYYITLSRLSYRWKPRTPHMAYPIQLGFQDATSPIIEELLHFHDHTLIIVFLISSLVLYIISLMLMTTLTHTSTIDAQEVETVWTILPAIILILIALPSLWILYMMVEINNPSLTVKTIGHQWYWSYEYTDYEDLSFNSYIIPTSELKPGELRLLEVDNLSCSANRNNNPNISFFWRCTTFLSRAFLGTKNRRNSRLPEPNNSYVNSTRSVLRTMFWNLWIKS